MKKDQGKKKREKFIEPFVPLKAADIEKATKLICEFALETNEPYDKKHIRNLLTKYADGKLPILLAKNKAGDVLGISGFICVPHLYNPNVMQAAEFIWYASDKLSRFDRASLMKRLLDIMIATCQKQKISLYVNTPTYSYLNDMLVFEGFRPKTISYVKEF
ncbi:MAG: hypothetical protein CVU62_08120 [Deltaproteobacteria bacterium HGW-Deltaproteobacteria-2]|jgi:hypothetical protein|nr:MAG: hypothetical protein CVU62_08120 [Deltaproteobacteria bacterium HGW-Deltaproteobacteria-2]